MKLYTILEYYSCNKYSKLIGQSEVHYFTKCHGYSYYILNQLETSSNVLRDPQALTQSLTINFRNTLSKATC